MRGCAVEEQIVYYGNLSVFTGRFLLHRAKLPRFLYFKVESSDLKIISILGSSVSEILMLTNLRRVTSSKPRRRLRTASSGLEKQKRPTVIKMQTYWE